ncbi:MAG: RagB/SusD family nutrient uptake outer membrane protein [Cyclobacteriaceae bacterium]
MNIINANTSLKGLLGLGMMIVLTIPFQSCELDEDPASSQLAVLPYETLAELELGVNGIYGQLIRAAWMTTFYVNGWSGDDMTTHRASNKADFREYDQRFITPDNSRSFTNWGAVYEMIRAANTVLANSEGVQLSDQAAQNRLIGETYFLRGLMFFHLTRIHGRIALPLSIVPDPEIGLATQIEVYEQIENDLIEAESRLPVTSNLGATRPNSGSARAILARLYLDWAGFPVREYTKYNSAIASAKQVIDNAAAHGFALVEDMGSLYTLAGRFNTESLYTIAYCADCGLSNRKHGKLGLPADFGGWQETFAEIRFFEDFPEGPRKDATYHTAVPVDADGNATSDVANAADFVPWTEFKDQQNPVFRKIVGPFEDAIWPGFESSRNDYYMRYAELLLIYAEASGRAGNLTADAWEALNMVRRRAAGLPPTVPDASVDVTSGDLAELAFAEKKWELAGEYLRWYDLVRMERVEEALGGDARNPRVSIGTVYDASGNATPVPLTEPSNPILGPLGQDNYFAPIPAQEIEKNPNLGNQGN